MSEQQESEVFQSHTQDASGMPISITLVGPDCKHYTYKR